MDVSEVVLLYLYVAPSHRGSGLGTRLMKEFFDHLQIHYKKQRIEIKLDDVSNRFGKEENIYRKFGFQYCEVDEEGPCGPEMSLEISF
jgi:GNAT superfamily N-acetyltransferase